MLPMLAEVLRYRELVRNLVLTELRLRYRRSVLGFLWTMLNPLLMMLVLTLVFSAVLRFDIRNYTVFLFAALLPWTFFSQSVTLSLMSIVNNGSLLHKVYFPRVVLPLAAVLSNLVNFLLALVPLALLMLALGSPLTPALAYLPVAILILTIFTAGLSLVFSVLNVYFRDFTHMTEVILALIFYLSPVIYPPTVIPEKYRFIVTFNPLSHMIDGFRRPIYDGVLPSLESVGASLAAALACFAVGVLVFRLRQDDLVFRV